MNSMTHNNQTSKVLTFLKEDKLDVIESTGFGITHI